MSDDRASPLGKADVEIIGRHVRYWPIADERHTGKLHWIITDSGEEHTGQSRGVSFEDAGREIDQFLRYKKLSRHFEKQRDARRDVGTRGNRSSWAPEDIKSQG